MASAGPVRRVIRNDVELVYRAAVELTERDEIEAGLSAELEQHAEIRCTWSEPGSSHVVVVSYTGVIPLDLTIDPDDPTFQGFSVGYGTDWDGAEEDARLDARFDTYYDGSGYEVIVREQWNVGAGRAAAGAGHEEPGAAQGAAEGVRPEGTPDGPICTGDYSPDSCWMEIAGRPGCHLWNAFPLGNETVTWSGECSGGLAQGMGRTTWYQNHEVKQVWESRRVDGKGNGWAVGRAFGDDAFLTEACYVNDEPREGGTTGYERTLRPGYNWTWDFWYSAGERVVINMKSDDLDSYLEVLRADGTELASNDDGGSGTNARLVFQAPAAGDYKIRARGYGNDDSGSFVLWVGDRDPGILTPGEPCGSG